MPKSYISQFIDKLNKPWTDWKTINKEEVTNEKKLIFTIEDSKITKIECTNVAAMDLKEEWRLMKLVKEKLQEFEKKLI